MQRGRGQGEEGGLVLFPGFRPQSLQCPHQGRSDEDAHTDVVDHNDNDNDDETVCSTK